MNDFAIRVRDVSKAYRVWHSPAARFKSITLHGVKHLVPLFSNRCAAAQARLFHDFYALRGINLEIRAGEAVGIIGRNGSGKSTLLQIIAGTLAPTAGSVEVNGRVAALLELGSGFNPDFTGRDNVFTYGSIFGLGKNELERHFDTIAAFADIGEFMDQPLKTYSTGMSLRLAFAVQSVLSPDVLIVDEALAVGDEAFQRKCFACIQRMKESGTSILFVSHSAQDIVRFCDRTLMLHEGRAVFVGEPRRVVALYQKFLYATPETKSLILENPEVALDTPTALRPQQAVQPREKESHPQEFFAADLSSQSEIHFDSRGAEIVSYRVLNEAGKKVNNLVNRLYYVIEVEVVFAAAFEAVAVGIMFTDKTGVEIAGASNWEIEKDLVSVRAGERLRTNFRFQCLLNAGTYFMRLGVATREHGFIHRIMDALVIKVSSAMPTWATGSSDCFFELEFQHGVESQSL